MMRQLAHNWLKVMVLRRAPVEVGVSGRLVLLEVKVLGAGVLVGRDRTEPGGVVGREVVLLQEIRLLKLYRLGVQSPSWSVKWVVWQVRC